MKTTYKNAQNFVTPGFADLWQEAEYVTDRAVHVYHIKERALCVEWLDDDEYGLTRQRHAALQAHRNDLAHKVLRQRQKRQQTPLHPVVQWLIADEFRPVDWQQLFCEWPTLSTTKPGEIAYSRDESKILADLQAVTPVSKYVARHWANLPSSITRDYVAAYTASTNASFAILTTLEGIVTAVEMGPPSCMKSRCNASSLTDRHNALGRHPSYGDTVEEWYTASAEARVGMPEPKWGAHPYAVYNPRLDWGIAIRKDNSGRIVGRAVVNTESKVWVRSFKQAVNSDGSYNDDGYSYTDEQLETYLCGEGYEKYQGWDGFKVDAIRHDSSGEYLMPYVDGNADKADLAYDGGHFTLGDTGADAQNTSGLMTLKESMGRCGDCDEEVYEEDSYIYVGRDEDILICDCCAHSYQRVTGASHRHGSDREYYVHDDDAINVDGTCYDGENLPDYIKECYDGEYRHEDDCTYADNRDAYFPCDGVVQALDEDGNTEAWFINDAYLGEDGMYYQTEEARDTANADEVDETEATTEGV